MTWKILKLTKRKPDARKNYNKCSRIRELKKQLNKPKEQEVKDG